MSDKQALELGKTMTKCTNGNFEAAGHSLGGGMASAIGTVNGCRTTVFNPAGLHPNTVAPYNKNVTSDSSNVSAFVVEGEVVNSSQDGATGLGRKMMLSSAQSHLPFKPCSPCSPHTRREALIGSHPSRVKNEPAGAGRPEGSELCGEAFDGHGYCLN